MRQTLELLRVQAPWLDVDGEMHGDEALDGDAGNGTTNGWRAVHNGPCGGSPQGVMRRGDVLRIKNDTNG